jgi:hypothetical protein
MDLCQKQRTYLLTPGLSHLTGMTELYPEREPLTLLSMFKDASNMNQFKSQLTPARLLLLAEAV